MYSVCHYFLKALTVVHEYINRTSTTSVYKDELIQKIQSCSLHNLSQQLYEFSQVLKVKIVRKQFLA